MLKPRKVARKSVSKTPRINHVTNTDKKKHHQETFATPALSTIIDSGAHRFRYDGLNVFINCQRTFDSYRIQEVFPRNRSPSHIHTLDALGLHLNCDERSCCLFPIEGQKIQIGAIYHHFLLKFDNREMMASVSLEIQPATPPCAERFTRNIAMKAAFALHKTKIEAANKALYEEIERIVNLYMEKPNANS